MKIQKRGSLDGEARTLFFSLAVIHYGSRRGVTYPQKIKQSENIRFAMFPAFSGVSTPATTKSVKVPVKIRKLQMNKNIKTPRSVTASVASAFLYMPTG